MLDKWLQFLMYKMYKLLWFMVPKRESRGRKRKRGDREDSPTCTFWKIHCMQDNLMVKMDIGQATCTKSLYCKFKFKTFADSKRLRRGHLKEHAVVFDQKRTLFWAMIKVVSSKQCFGGIYNKLHKLKYDYINRQYTCVYY